MSFVHSISLQALSLLSAAVVALFPIDEAAAVEIIEIGDGTRYQCVDNKVHRLRLNRSSVEMTSAQIRSALYTLRETIRKLKNEIREAKARRQNKLVRSLTAKLSKAQITQAGINQCRT